MIGFGIEVKEIENKIHYKSIKLKQRINQKALTEDMFVREQISKQIETLKDELRVLEKELAKRVRDRIIEMYRTND